MNHLAANMVHGWNERIVI